VLAYMTSPALRALGDAFHAGAEVRRKAVEEAEAAYRKLVSHDPSHELLPSGDELDDPKKFAAALRATVAWISVKPGRFPDIGQRVSLIAVLDDNQMTWPFAA
jgi:hypothetical protein